MTATAPGLTRHTVELPRLATQHVEAWYELHAKEPHLDSPYFHPAFARAVHESGRPVHVLVNERNGGGADSLLPHHRTGRAGSQPVGWPGADFQGPLAAAGTVLSRDALVAPGCRWFRFDHLVDAYGGVDRWAVARRTSPFIDVSGGLPGYLGRASRSGKDNIGQARRRAARAERELGRLRFSVDVIDDALLERVIALKRHQYAVTGARDYFATPDRARLLYRLMRTHEDGFAGVLSAVHAGDELLAGHFGIRSGGVLHWWFPVYDPQHARLAPGWILLRELIAAAPSIGVHRIDLGRGDDEYKRRAKTGEAVVVEGVVGSPARVAGQRVGELARQRAAAALTRTGLAGPVRGILRRSPPPQPGREVGAAAPCAPSVKRAPV